MNPTVDSAFGSLVKTGKEFALAIRPFQQPKPCLVARANDADGPVRRVNGFGVVSIIPSSFHEKLFVGAKIR